MSNRIMPSPSTTRAAIRRTERLLDRLAPFKRDADIQWWIRLEQEVLAKLLKHARRR